MKEKSYSFDFLVKKTCDYGVQCQAKDGAMPAGRNGPHNHHMTGARETGHWAMLFTYAAQIAGNSIYQKCANAAYDALLSRSFCPLDGAYWHRQEDYRSSYNGLIGQAWTLESLLYGYKILGRKDLYVAANNLIEKHKFDERRGLWHEADLDGSARQIGGTLNQQIWFTAMLAKFSNAEDERVIRFLDRLLDNSTIRLSGLYYTGIPQKNFIRKSYTSTQKWLKYGILNDPRYGIDCGYHLFTLVGLAMLYEHCSSHNYFSSKPFTKALRFAFSSNYSDALKKSAFGYQYNVPGFEFPYVYTVFSERLLPNSLDIVIQTFKHQIDSHLDRETYLLNRGSVDGVTLLSRTYEIYRIPYQLLNHLETL